MVKHALGYLNDFLSTDNIFEIVNSYILSFEFEFKI
jgi:hypothetical protein